MPTLKVGSKVWPTCGGILQYESAVHNATMIKEIGSEIRNLNTSSFVSTNKIHIRQLFLSNK